LTRSDGATWSTFAGGYVSLDGRLVSTTPEWTSGSSGGDKGSSTVSGAKGPNAKSTENILAPTKNLQGLAFTYYGVGIAKEHGLVSATIHRLYGEDEHLRS